MILMDAANLQRARLGEAHPCVVEHEEKQGRRMRKRVEPFENLLQDKIRNAVGTQLVRPHPEEGSDGERRSPKQSIRLMKPEVTRQESVKGKRQVSQ